MPPAAVTELTDLKQLFAEFDKSKDALVEEFLTFLKFKSISAEAEYRSDCRACCDWLVSYLKDAGLKVEVWEGAGHPTIFASYDGAGKDKPTALIYNHYDVQAVDPLNLWKSPPFEPLIEGEEIYARGAVDDKGQCFYVIAAVRWLLKNKGKLPLNLKLLIEGEEETGSATLAGQLASKQKELAADYLFIVDLGFHDKSSPALTLGVRGIVTMTVEIRGSKGDLHSGMVGGVVYNPNRALAGLLAKLHDADGKVAIPGFYDDVLDVAAKDMQSIDFHYDEDGFVKMFEAKPVGGEHKKFTPMQRAWIRPTVEINGMGGGYTGDGFKTVIPAIAIAKLSCRLVPNQDPEKIGKLVENFLQQHKPDAVDLTVRLHPGIGDAVRTRVDSKPVQVTAEVLSEIFAKPCGFIFSGGSIPIVASLAQACKTDDVVMMGFGLPDDNLHAPNEHFGIDRLRNGFVTIASVIERL